MQPFMHVACLLKMIMMIIKKRQGSGAPQGIIYKDPLILISPQILYANNYLLVEIFEFKSSFSTQLF